MFCNWDQAYTTRTGNFNGNNSGNDENNNNNNNNNNEDNAYENNDDDDDYNYDNNNNVAIISEFSCCPNQRRNILNIRQHPKGALTNKYPGFDILCTSHYGEYTDAFIDHFSVLTKPIT